MAHEIEAPNATAVAAAGAGADKDQTEADLHRWCWGGGTVGQQTQFRHAMLRRCKWQSEGEGLLNRNVLPISRFVN